MDSGDIDNQEEWSTVGTKLQRKSKSSKHSKGTAQPLKQSSGGNKEQPHRGLSKNSKKSTTTAAVTDGTVEEGAELDLNSSLSSLTLVAPRISTNSEWNKKISLERSSVVRPEDSRDYSSAALSSVVTPVEFMMCANTPDSAVDATTPSLIVKGLTNSGNACFRNCILQALLAAPSFRRFAVTASSSKRQFDGALKAWDALLDFVADFADETHNSALRPDDYLKILFNAFASHISTHCALPSRLGGRATQEDAMEFFTFFLDILHEEQLEAEGSLTPEDALRLKQHRAQVPAFSCSGGNAESLENNEDDGWSTVAKTKVVLSETSRGEERAALTSTVVSSLFHGLLRSEVLYKAKNTCSVTFQRFHCLSLPVSDRNHANRTVDLESLLDIYFAEEIIDDGKIRKRVSLEVIPTVLVINLARFSFDYARNTPIKVHTEVEYPMTLEFPDKFLSENLRSSSAVQSREYVLHAVVLHHGRKATGGHYSSFVRVSADKWVAMNDARISSLSKHQAASATDQAYILVYERNNVKP